MCLYEAIGTAILITALNLSQGDAFAIGIALFTIVVFIGPISGAHVNPAVTLSVFIKETRNQEKIGKNFVFMLFIILSQLVGAIVGTCIVYGTQSFENNLPVPGIVVLCPAEQLLAKVDDQLYCDPKDGLAAFNVFLAEMIGSFVYCAVVLSIKYHNGGADILNGLAIGGTLFGMLSTVDKITGACINPAVGLV